MALSRGSKLGIIVGLLGTMLGVGGSGIVARFLLRAEPPWTVADQDLGAAAAERPHRDLDGVGAQEAPALG